VRVLAGRDLLNLWEQGERLHPIDRAMALVAAAFPEFAWGELVALSIGQRDKLLLELREGLFGPRMEVFVECPRCQQQLEFALSTMDLRAMSPAKSPPPEATLTIGEVEVLYRLPNSADMAAIAAHSEANAARADLLRRCILEARRGQEEIPIEALPESAVQILGAEMEAKDPLAELRMELSCPECKHTWSALLDIVQFLWIEISVQVRRLLHEVHLLARHYGWRETDILAMSSRRRLLYLEMVS
jgi:hypothetical protein